MSLTRAVWNAIAVVAVCATVSAHHSTVAYLPQSIAIHDATIDKVLWSNPHIILAFSVKAASGAATSWSVETGSPTSVAQLGWNRNSVKVGDKVTVELYPAKNGAHVGRLRKLIYPDGRELLDTQNPTALKP